MFQYIRSVRVEYVVQVSSATTFYIDHWNVFENIRHADKRTDRQTDTFAITGTETQFYKLRIVCWWYGMMVRCGGYIIRSIIAKMYTILQCTRFVRVEYVVCKSSVTN